MFIFGICMRVGVVILPVIVKIALDYNYNKFSKRFSSSATGNNLNINLFIYPFGLRCFSKLELSKEQIEKLPPPLPDLLDAPCITKFGCVECCPGIEYISEEELTVVTFCIACKLKSLF